MSSEVPMWTQERAYTSPIWSYVDQGTGSDRLTIDIWVDRENLDSLSNYERVLLDPMNYDHVRESDWVRISTERLEQARTLARERFVAKLGERFPVVEQPGAGIIRVRSAITRFQAQRAFDTPDRDQLPEKAFVNSRPGRVTTEFELADSVTGERVGACVVTARGSFLDWDTENGIYEQSKLGLRCTAALLRYLLDRAHGSASNPASG